MVYIFFIIDSSAPVSLKKMNDKPHQKVESITPEALISHIDQRLPERPFHHLRTHDTKQNKNI